MSIVDSLRGLRERSKRVVLPVLMNLALLSTLTLRAAASPAAQAGTPACVLVPIAGSEGSISYPGPEISGSGQFVVYSGSVDVPPGGNSIQFFSYNVLNKIYEKVSLSHDGEWEYNDDAYSADPSLTDEGNLVVFHSNADEMVPGGVVGAQLYLRDMIHKTTELISQNSAGEAGNGPSWTSSITPDGRYVIFSSDARNLDPNDTNNRTDAYLRDRQAGTTERVSIASDGSQGFSEEEFGTYPVDISNDARYVVFHSDDLKDDDGTLRDGLFLRDLVEERTFWIAGGDYVRISGDGRFIVFNSRDALVPEDENTDDDIYLYDRQADDFELISAALDGTAAGLSRDAVVSEDGSVVVYPSRASNLVAGDTNDMTDIFLRDRTAGETLRLTVNASGQQADGNSSAPSVSADGQRIAFSSRATNLAQSSISLQDVFLCQRIPGGLALDFRLHLPIVGR